MFVKNKIGICSVILLCYLFSSKKVMNAGLQFLKYSC